MNTRIAGKAAVILGAGSKTVVAGSIGGADTHGGTRGQAFQLPWHGAHATDRGLS
jgi:hypothetical protein